MTWTFNLTYGFPSDVANYRGQGHSFVRLGNTCATTADAVKSP
jgi:hypothetical protein